jgi:hypothetical protein
MGKVFDRRRVELPNLVDFRFSPSPMSNRPFRGIPIPMNECFSVEHFHTRYAAFDIGVIPSQWAVPGSKFNTSLGVGRFSASEQPERAGWMVPGGTPSYDRHSETEKDYVLALRHLLSVVIDRRQIRISPS